MPSANSNPSNGDRTPVVRTLAERVKARVAEAGVALDGRSGKAKSKYKNLRPTRLTRAASPLTEGSEAQREARSMRRVYAEMKVTYQRYRRQTGKPAVPALRDAVRAFQRGQSLPALVEVATFLDDRGLLAW
jgi:hypothetical protein